MRTGDLLVEAGLVSRSAVDRALQLAASTGSRVGEVLVSMGAVDSTDIATLLASQWNLPFVKLATTASDPQLLARLDVDAAVHGRYLPLHVVHDAALVAFSDLPDQAALSTISAMLGMPVLPAIAEQWDLQEATLDRLGDQVVSKAAFGLWGRNPDQSARTVLVTWQKWAGAVAAVLLAASFALWPRTSAAVAVTSISLMFAAAVVFKFSAVVYGARTDRPEAAATITDDHGLPKYTVLVPVFHEENIVAQLIDNLGALDYPAHLLEVLILVEEGDPATAQAALAANPPPHFKIVTVPAGGPQTKPKACNVGLEFATGQLLVIFDAEDKPDPDQLRKAVAAFRAAGPDLVCVQAALNYFNWSESALTRLFTLEYSWWFDFMLPGLERAKLPIPLGGTSNHFRVDGLRRLGGWDPFNVTEDADLGIRATAMGMRVGVIESTTFEEANNHVPNFIRQRSRWIKGYMQTTLVHLRHPAQLVKVAGWRQSLSFLFLVAGTPATFLAVPVLYALSLAALVAGPGALSFLFPGWALWLSLANLGIGSTLMMWLSMAGTLRRDRFALVVWGLANPVYWLLHSVAAYKAAWQLIRRPHHWEKTNHGLTKFTAAAHA